MKRRWSFTATLLLALLLGAGLASGQDNFQVVRNVRLLASPNLGQRIKTLHPPERVTATGGKNGDYIRVEDSDGNFGWVYSPYLEAVPPSATSPGITSGAGRNTGSPGSVGAVPQGPTDASAFAIAECQPEGTATSAAEIKGNPLKNRLQAPEPTLVQVTSLNAFLAPGADAGRWDMNRGAEIEGYVDTVKSGGPETCNCGSDNPDDYDTHIEISVHPHDPKGERMIVEVTPPWRRLMATVNQDWSTQALKASILHRQIRVRGWLFFDARHASAATNTHTGTQKPWRGTAWEVHPITALEVLPVQ